MYKTTGLEQEETLQQYYSYVNTEVLQSHFHRLHAESRMKKSTALIASACRRKYQWQYELMN